MWGVFTGFKATKWDNVVVGSIFIVGLFVCGGLCLWGSKLQNGITMLLIQSFLLVQLFVCFLCVSMGFYATKWNNVVADSVCIVGPLVCGGLCLVLVLLSSIKCLFLFSLSFFAIISLGWRELVALHL